MPSRASTISPQSTPRRRLALERLEPRLLLTFVEGTVFFDSNFNGAFDGRDFGVPGVEVFDDIDKNGVRNGAEGFVQSTANGRYSFDPSLFPGYSGNLTLALSSSFQLTSPLAPSITTANSALGLGFFGLAQGHFNADRRPDLLLLNDNANSISALLNNGSGGFIPAPGVTLQGVPSFTVADLDNDGDDDVVLGFVNGMTVLRCNGAGQFTAQTIPGAAGFSVVAADFNGDAFLDLAVMNPTTEAVTVLINNGGTNISFTARSPVTVAGGGALGVTRLSGDAAPDLVVVSSDYVGPSFTGELTITALANNGAGVLSFRDETVIEFQNELFDVAVGDMTGDGIADVVTLRDGGIVDIERGNAQGEFFSGLQFGVTSFLNGSFIAELMLVDFDHDGDLDIVAPEVLEQLGPSGALRFLRNIGAGVFESEGISIGALEGAAPDALAAGDFNGDGTIDFALAWSPPTEFNSRLTLYFNTLQPGRYSERDFAFDPAELDGRNFGFAPLTPNKSQGDYNGDGSVTVLDYRVWLANLAQTAGPGVAADGDNNHRVEGADFLLWQRKFNGAQSVSAAEVAGAASVSASLYAAAEFPGQEWPENAWLPAGPAHAMPRLEAAHDAARSLRMVRTDFREEFFARLAAPAVVSPTILPMAKLRAEMRPTVGVPSSAAAHDGETAIDGAFREFSQLSAYLSPLRRGL